VIPRHQPAARAGRPQHNLLSAALASLNLSYRGKVAEPIAEVALLRRGLVCSIIAHGYIAFLEGRNKHANPIHHRAGCWSPPHIRLEAPTAHADPDPITRESGEIGSFTLHSTGGGVGAIVDIDLFGPFATDRRNNQPAVPRISTVFSQHITLMVTQIDITGPATIFHFTQMGGLAFKDVFPFAGGDVSFGYMLSLGYSFQQINHELNVEGPLTLLANTSADDYSPFANGGRHNATLTDVDNDVGSIVLFGGDAAGYGDFWQIADQS